MASSIHLARETTRESLLRSGASAAGSIRQGPRSRVSSFISTLRHDDWFGGKTIGMFAGIALLINNITGPGVPSLPNMFAEAGWLFPTICFIAVWLMTSASTGMYCEAMRRIPGNAGFKGRVEYTSIVKYFFGRGGYIAAQIGLNGALQSLNIISIIQSAQVMDNLITAIFGQSCALNLSPFANSFNGTAIAASEEFWSCMDTQNPVGGSAWGCHVVLSMGFLAALILTLPMGYFNLDDNAIIQVVAFVLTLLCWAVWFIACWFAPPISGGTWAIPAVNSTPGVGSQAGVVGTILFNFGFVTTVPSWVNEKKPSVSVNKSVWLSTFLCNVIFFMIGIPGAMAFQSFLQGPATNTCASPDMDGNCASDLMAVLSSARWSPFKHGSPMAVTVAISTYLFPVVAVLSSIPVFSIVVKYNCIENGLSHSFSFFWGVLAPWIVALPLLYQPNALNQFISFSSLLFVSFTDFVVPFCLYIVLMQQDMYDAKLEAIMDDDDLDEQQARNDDMLDFEERQAMDMLAHSRPTTSSATSHKPSSSLYGSVQTAPGALRSEHSMMSRISHASRLNSLPLLPDKPEDAVAASAEHFAFPQRLRLSPRSRCSIAVVLVLTMAGVSIAGIYLSIITSVTTTWDCVAVGAS